MKARIKVSAHDGKLVIDLPHDVVSGCGWKNETRSMWKSLAQRMARWLCDRV